MVYGEGGGNEGGERWTLNGGQQERMGQQVGRVVVWTARKRISNPLSSPRGKRGERSYPANARFRAAVGEQDPISDLARLQYKRV